MSWVQRARVELSSLLARPATLQESISYAMEMKAGLDGVNVPDRVRRAKWSVH